MIVYRLQGSYRIVRPLPSDQPRHADDAFHREHARKVIMVESGSHFDPDVVAAFQRCEAEFLAIRDEFNEDATPTAARQEAGR